MTSTTWSSSASCSPPSPVSSRVHAHVSDATPYQHAAAKLAALLRFFSASCRGTPGVVPVRLRNIVPEITLPLRTIDVVRFSQARCQLVTWCKTSSAACPHHLQHLEISVAVTLLACMQLIQGSNPASCKSQTFLITFCFLTRFPSSATSGASSVFQNSRRDTSSDRVHTAIHLQFRQVKQTPLLNINPGLLPSSHQNE
jgi:hypothetical protein